MKELHPPCPCQSTTLLVVHFTSPNGRNASYLLVRALCPKGQISSTPIIFSPHPTSFYHLILQIVKRQPTFPRIHLTHLIHMLLLVRAGFDIGMHFSSLCQPQGMGLKTTSARFFQLLHNSLDQEQAIMQPNEPNGCSLGWVWSLPLVCEFGRGFFSVGGWSSLRQTDYLLCHAPIIPPTYTFRTGMQIVVCFDSRMREKGEEGLVS